MAYGTEKGISVGGAIPVNLHVSVDTPPWFRDGEELPCVSDPELFFPDDYSKSNRQQIAEAKDVCRRFCPMLRECREWATERAELDGIWGATTPAQRRRSRGVARKKAS